MSQPEAIGLDGVDAPQPTWRPSDVALIAVLGAVGIYGVMMVIQGPLVAKLFASLGFGATEAGVPSGEAVEYVYLLQSVTGAILAGWMATCIGLAVGPVRRRERWAWTTLCVAFALWFALDTTYSIAAGHHSHAVFNVGFALVLAVALTAVRPRRRVTRADA